MDKEIKDIIFYDLEALKDSRKNKKEFDYHFELLKGNLKDFFKKNENNITSKIKKRNTN